MTTENEITKLSATGLANAIRNGELTSVQATKAFLKKIEEVNPTLNAVIWMNPKALEQAADADSLLADGRAIGPLHGVPITIKECFDWVGSPTTIGLESRKNNISQDTDPYVQRLLDAGAIILGKTNVPQLMVYFEGENRVYGRTLNPWNHKFASGGSSSGEGSIIGAGASPFGLGSDIGGSLRVPAAFCGICSIKPTMSRTYDFTKVTDPPRIYGINPVTGPMSRYVEDLALGLSIIDGVLSPVQSQPQPLGDYTTVRLQGLKVGFFLNDGFFEPMPVMKRAVREAAEILRSQGALVKEWQPYQLGKAEEIFFRTLSADNGGVFAEALGEEKPMPQSKDLLMLSQAPAWKRQLLASIAKLTGQKLAQRIIPFFGYAGPDHRAAVEAEQKTYIADFLKEMGDLDLLICPTGPVPAYLHRSFGDMGLGGAYQIAFNVLGFPAGVVPVTNVRASETTPREAGWDMAQRAAAKIEAQCLGMPVGVQIIAKPLQEHLVLAAMKSIQDSVGVFHV